MSNADVEQRCANCGILFTWPPTYRGGLAYCCLGCALGGPCRCSYDNAKTGPMKMILVIVQDEDAERLIATLERENYRATVIASSGGFLRRGNTTLLIGTEAEAVPRALTLIQQSCRVRAQEIPPPAPLAPFGGPLPATIAVPVGGAIIFVWNVEHYERA